MTPSNYNGTSRLDDQNNTSTFAKPYLKGNFLGDSQYNSHHPNDDEDVKVEEAN